MNKPMQVLPIMTPEGLSLSSATTVTVQEYLYLLGDDDPAYLYRQIMDQVERPLLEALMDHTNRNQSRTAACLGINRATLRSKLERHSLFFS